MKAVLFDLDGTLTDPKPGIEGCIRHALREMGLPAPVGDLGWCIGPPLGESFARLLGTNDRATIARAVEHYRDRFSAVGLYENSVYEGIPECLRELGNSGRRLFVATSKPIVFARRIVSRFGLTEHFDGIYGSELDGSLSDKGELIGALLKREGLSSGEAVMVGDREHDGIGAAKNGVAFVGVLYGYGAREALLEAGAVRLCAEPGEITRTTLDLGWSGQTR